MKVTINNNQKGFQPFSVNIEFKTVYDVVRFLAHLNITDNDIKSSTLSLDAPLNKVKVDTAIDWEELGEKIEQHVVSMLNNK